MLIQLSGTIMSNVAKAVVTKVSGLKHPDHVFSQTESLAFVLPLKSLIQKSLLSKIFCRNFLCQIFQLHFEWQQC